MGTKGKVHRLGADVKLGIISQFFAQMLTCATFWLSVDINMKVVAIGFNSPLTRSEWLMLLTSGLGVLHHIDHVLRFDHSGWPFRDIVTPFTYSLLVYPLLAVAFFWRHGGWSRFAIVLLIFLLTQSAHIFLETPAQQFCVWAYNASCTTGNAAGMPNLLGLRSPLMGVAAVLLSCALSGILIATCVSLFFDARRASA